MNIKKQIEEIENQIEALRQKKEDLRIEFLLSAKNIVAPILKDAVGCIGYGRLLIKDEDVIKAFREIYKGHYVYDISSLYHWNVDIVKSKISTNDNICFIASDSDYYIGQFGSDLEAVEFANEFDMIVDIKDLTNNREHYIKTLYETEERIKLFKKNCRTK